MSQLVNILIRAAEHNKIIFITLSVLFLFSNPVKAQLVPDLTLGSENSTVVPVNSTRDEIRGGATRGSNLFHSFSEFNVNSGREVYFNNPAGVQNIINRVTGSNLSNIFGTLGVNGNANLYLINPNGIVFGDGVILDINGTFIGTTADGVRLGTNDVYSASDPASSSLLTIQPGALFVNRVRNARSRIINQGNLQVNPGSNLTLSADEINNNASINAPGGKIFLEAVNGDINTANINTIDLINGGGDITISAAGNINVSGRIDAAGGNFELSPEFETIARSERIAPGGNISLTAANNISLNDSLLLANGSRGSSIEITSLGNLMGNNLFIETKSTADLINTTGGHIKINSRSIELNNSFVQGRTESRVNVGDIFVNTDLLRLENGAQITASTRGKGNSGNLTITARSISLINNNPVNNFPSGLFTSTFATGNAGELRIDTEELLLENGAQISTSTFGPGKGNNLIINAKDIQIIGREVNNISSGLFSQTQETGDAGSLSINTNLLRLDNGAVISASTIAEGNAGEIRINTNLLRLDNGARILAITIAEGNAGELSIQAKNIEIIGADPVNDSASGLFASAFDAFANNTDGNGGNITIATDRLKIENGAIISTSNFQSRNLRPPGLGRAGNITIKAKEIVLDRGRISARGNLKGGGDIIIHSDNFLFLKDRSEITTDVGQTIGFTGGNLTINTPLIIANPAKNLISATAITSMGGNININTNTILGYPQFLTIDASSDLGIDGNVSITGIIDLNFELLQAEPALISQTPSQLTQCPLNGLQTALFSEINDLGEKLKLEPFQKIHSDLKLDRNGSKQKPFNPAVGWYRQTDGTVVLTSNPAEVRPLNEGSDDPISCVKYS